MNSRGKNKTDDVAIYPQGTVYLYEVMRWIVDLDREVIIDFVRLIDEHIADWGFTKMLKDYVDSLDWAEYEEMNE